MKKKESLRGLLPGNQPPVQPDTRVDEAVYGDGELPDDFIDKIKDLSSGGARALTESGEVRLGHYRLTARGLVSEDGATEAEWELLGKALFNMHGRIQLLIGDWLAQGEHIWGKTYTQMATTTGLEEKTLRNYKHVANSVEMSLRRDNLTYSHYSLVAGVKDTRRKARLLELASDEGWSVARLREILAERKPELPTGKGYDAKAAKRDMAELATEIAKLERGERPNPAKLEIALDNIERLQEFLDIAQAKLRSQLDD